MSLFASDYSPVSPSSPIKTGPSANDLTPRISRSSPLRSSKLGPNGEMHEDPDPNIDQVTGLPTPPRSPPSDDSSKMDLNNGGVRTPSDGSRSGSGDGTVNSWNKSNSSKSSATLMELSADPLDKPFAPSKKLAGYNSFEGCMEGRSLLDDGAETRLTTRGNGPRSQSQVIPPRYRESLPPLEPS
jgi:hypothetical protein